MYYTYMYGFAANRHNDSIVVVYVYTGSSLSSYLDLPLLNYALDCVHDCNSETMTCIIYTVLLSILCPQ